MPMAWKGVTVAERITLTCWHCGESREADVPHLPQFGFELAGWAGDVGMVGYADMRYGRVLIFCNPEHARAEMTKSGTFRMRPRGVEGLDHQTVCTGGTDDRS